MDDVVTFRASFWTLFGWMMAWVIGLSLGIGLIVVVAAMRAASNTGFPWPYLIAGILPGVVLGAMAVVYLLPRLMTEVGPQGVRARDFLGADRHVEWHQIASARCVGFGGLRFVRLHAGDGEPDLWVPLFLHDKAGFAEAVARFAPEGSPLRRQVARG